MTEDIKGDLEKSNVGEEITKAYENINMNLIIKKFQH